MHRNVYSSNVHTAKLWEEPRCPSTDERIKKMLCVCVCVCTHRHTHTHRNTVQCGILCSVEYYAAIKQIKMLCVRVCVYTHTHTHTHTHTYTQWNTMQPSKPLNLAIYIDMDGTRGYYAERNKSVREGQLSYDLPDMRK